MVQSKNPIVCKFPYRYEQTQGIRNEPDEQKSSASFQKLVHAHNRIWVFGGEYKTKIINK